MVLKLITDNMRWNVNKQYFTHLVAQQACSISELFDRQDQLSSTIVNCTNRCTVDTNMVFFALNDVALTCKKNSFDTYFQTAYADMWSSFVAVRPRLQSLRLPSNNKLTRVESIVETFVIATQMRHSTQLWRRYRERAISLYSLSNREQVALEDVMILYGCKYYCAVFRLSRSKRSYLAHLASIRSNRDAIRHSLQRNTHYSNNSYYGHIATVLDCFGSSRAVVAENIATDVSVTASITCNGRSIFDTFDFHKFGKNTATFSCSVKSLDCSMQYFLKDNCELRRYTLSSNTRHKQNCYFNVKCVNQTNNGKCEYFVLDNAHCVAVSGKDYYVAYCCVVDDNIVPIECANFSNTNSVKLNLSTKCQLESDKSTHIDIVTVYATSMPQLLDNLSVVATIGYTRCPCCEDEYCQGQLYSVATNISSANNMFLCEDNCPPSNVVKYTYQFGDGEVATLVDNGGYSATLLEGFCFGIGNEKIYNIYHGKVTQINCGKFAVQDDGYCYNSRIGNNACLLTTSHKSNSKLWRIESVGGCLVVLPFEETSKVSFVDNCFEITSNSRHWQIRVSSNLTCYTTNNIECNVNRLRTKLSNDLDCGSCIVLYFSKGIADITISNHNSTPKASPILRESLLSTYLNYINNKNAFLIANRLKNIDALTVASLVYTNKNFVKRYILQCQQSNNQSSGKCLYYNQFGNLVAGYDNMAYALALVYYVAITGDKSVLTDSVIHQLCDIAHNTQCSGHQLCVKALVLLKMSQLGISKVQSLIAYTNTKATITSDSKIYSYAQVIGAVPMVNASKQRLKDLCNKHNIPKCWYYVSQVENLYGINVVGNRLTVKPTVTSSEALEQLAINLSSKRIDTVFSKDSVYSLVLNGKKCYQGVDLSLLEQDNNQLIVRF